MIKFKLNVACEGISIEYCENEAARKGASYQECRDNDNIFYLTNQGNWIVEDELYFDTLNAMQEYVKNTDLPEVKIHRCDDNKYELEDKNHFNYSYSFYELNEENEFIPINEDNIVYSKVVIEV